MSPPGPTLLRLAQERRYDQLQLHLKSYPQDVLWSDGLGTTVLHFLCHSQIIDESLLKAVEAIINEAPFLVQKRNHASWTPLHLACEKRIGIGRISWNATATTNNIVSRSDAIATNNINTQQLIVLLIKACPGSVSLPLTSGFKAKTPFHVLCENDDNCSLMCLKEILRIDPSLALQSCVKHESPYTICDTPLQELWNTITTAKSNSLAINDEDFLKMELLLQATQQTTSGGHHHHNRHQDRGEEKNDEEKDDSSCCTSKNDNGNNDTSTKFHILCAACSIRCPRHYMCELLKRCPEQMRKANSMGLLPLHCAVQSAQPESPFYTDFLLDQLLTIYPEAASIPIPVSKTISLQSSAQQRKRSSTTRKHPKQHEEHNDNDAGNDNEDCAHVRTTTDDTSERGKYEEIGGGEQKGEGRQQQRQPVILSIHVLIADRGCTNQNGGIQRLIRAYPDSLRIPDPRSGLVPALASAEAAIQSRLNLSTTYALLRAAPDVIICRQK